VTSWTVTPTSTYLIGIREDLDLEAGTPLQYVGTLDGAYSVTGAVLANLVDQGISLVVSTTLTATAPEAVIVARMRDAGLTPRPGTVSRYVLRVQGAGEIPIGTTVQGGGPLGRSRWTVIDPTAIYADDAPITVEAVEQGPTSITSPTTLTLVTPVVGVTGLGYDVADGEPFALGTLPESLPSMRVRLQQRRAAPGSPQGVRTALRDLPWVVAADVGGASGVVSVTIAPAPVGADREAELAGALLASIPAGASTAGTDSVTGPDVNGVDVLWYYTPGTTVAVATVLEITTDGTITDADAIAAASAATSGVYALLGNGDPILRLRILAAVGGVQGITGATLTLDGTGAASVSPPTVADVLVASPLTVTIA